MKNLLLTILVSLVSFVSFSQETQNITVGKDLTLDEKDRLAGIEMQNYSKEFYSGIKMIGFGQVLVWSGVYMITNSTIKVEAPSPLIPDNCINCVQEPTQYVDGVNTTKKTVGTILSITGGIFSLIGTHHVIEAPIHIKNAGLILSGNGVGIVIKM
jgi:hypothetical protein